MKRLIIISILFVVSLISYGKVRKNSGIINIKPLRNIATRYWVTDLWGDVSYTFYPDAYNIHNYTTTTNDIFQSYYLEYLELSSQFYDFGLNAEIYNNDFQSFKFTFGLNYSTGHFYDKQLPGKLLSHWIDMDFGIRMQYISFGFNCSALLHCSSKDAYESSLFKYTYCYNNLVPSGYIGYNLEFPHVMLTAEAKFGMHKISHDKVFALSPGSNQYQLPITLSIKILYKLLSTDRVDKKTNWW